MADHGPSRGDRHSPAPTLDDVARRCGVSRQTVSNVVNGTGRVGEATRARVVAAIEDLGFVRHLGAASLRSGRAGRFAYVLPAGEPREENTILLEFLQHLVTAAGARGQQMLVIAPGDDPSAGTELDALVRSRSIDAAVLSAVGEHDARVAHLSRLGVPFACFGRTAATDPQAWVDVDNRAGVHSATLAALEHGHRAVAFVGYRSPARWDADRESGYRDAMTGAGLRTSLTLVDPDDPVATVRELLGRPSPPTALITGSDVLAASCYAAASAVGRTVGRDLAVVGFDGTLAARLLSPPLATVRIPLARIAEVIVRRLLGELPNDVGTVIDTELVPGGSLCPPA